MPPESEVERPRVDPGALALATVAGAVAFILGPGEWDALAVVIGSMLLLILLAHHHAAPATLTARSLLLRGAFGATTGLAFCIAIAPGIQHLIVAPFFHVEDDEGYSLDAWHTTGAISVLWAFIAVTLTVLEPRIASLLDKPWRGRRKDDDQLGTGFGSER